MDGFDALGWAKVVFGEKKNLEYYQEWQLKSSCNCSLMCPLGVGAIRFRLTIHVITVGIKCPLSNAPK